MSETIWIHYARPRPHWYALPQDERSAKRAVWDDTARASTEAGARHMGTYHIRGQHDFETVEIWTFQSPEAALDHWSRLTAAAYNEWFAFANNIGRAGDPLP